jgi:alpha-ketoglutarate-dependent taurine dioxygenase
LTLMSTSRDQPAVVTRPGVLPVVLSPPSPGLPVAGARELDREIDAALREHGGVLFRGFSVAGSEEFRRFARGFGHPLVNYEFGSTPRSRIADGVYSSTEYPAHQQIPLHNEQSYARDWPMKIWFHCQIASSRGGETPIADSRKVYQRIDPGIRRRFAEHGVLYVRNYGNGLDVPWQRVFDTNDPAVAEAYCRSHAISYAWTEDGELRTRQVAQSAIRHPRSHDTVWFNQAHLFHLSALEPGVREALLEAVEPDQLPRNAYYGDGRVIEDSVLDEIRGVYAELQVVFPWQAGDVLMLDNMLVAHGRAPFSGPRQILVGMAEPVSQDQVSP